MITCCLSYLSPSGSAQLAYIEFHYNIQICAAAMRNCHAVPGGTVAAAALPLRDSTQIKRCNGSMESWPPNKDMTPAAMSHCIGCDFSCDCTADKQAYIELQRSIYIYIYNSVKPDDGIQVSCQLYVAA